MPNIDESVYTKTTAYTAPTDVGSPSADDFLARERALLGDDATQFATDDDLLGGDSSAEQQQQAPEAQFEAQFPDITNEVCSTPPTNAAGTYSNGLLYTASRTQWYRHRPVSELQLGIQCAGGGRAGARGDQGVA